MVIPSVFKKPACGLVLLLIGNVLSYSEAYAQVNRPTIIAGTQIPLQYNAGLQYRFTPTLSGRVQLGIFTKPYDQLLVSTMQIFGLEKNLGRLIENSLEMGFTANLGANYHFGKNYVGINTQLVRLQGSTSLANALSVYFNDDFSFLAPGGQSLLDVSARSNLFNLGLLYGRRFTLPNPRFAILAEGGLAKIMASHNRFSLGNDFLESIPLVQELYSNLDADFRRAYWRHGFIPTLSIYLTYQL
jgi:hypothetical protein